MAMGVHRTAMSLGALLLTAGCHPSIGQLDEAIASHIDCGDTRLGNDFTVRLTKYNSGSLDGGEIWIVAACHSARTACVPLVSYDHAPPPAYSLSDDGLITIEIFGGMIRKLHGSEINLGVAKHQVLVKQSGRTRGEDVDKFRARIGFPLGGWYRDMCDEARDVAAAWSGQ